MVLMMRRSGGLVEGIPGLLGWKGGWIRRIGILGSRRFGMRRRARLRGRKGIWMRWMFSVVDISTSCPLVGRSYSCP
ncbi:hypothetical protein BDN72DRAFT_410422 [Pluteus cervinus]|uniref:Uncharacterized protein n=1 Tax=Pluteus cervinus TaxID=181527 RepID=A0ACD3B2M6_9AGAR|nr:hypothetical protein BDN72DRAFT_410422 [Pluteus cervinus]